MYTDPTGQFLVPSTKGNEYILCGYDYDSNHVFAEPMKNRKKASQIRAVTTIIRKLKAAGLQPTFHILDYEVSTELIGFLETDEKNRPVSARPMPSQECGRKSKYNVQKSFH